MLNYLPCSKSSWSETLVRKREIYRHFVEEMIVMPGAEDNVTNNDIFNLDHPLNYHPDSKWQTYFKDNDVLLQIDKDVRRLSPDISFFQQPTDYPCIQVVNSNGIKRLHQRVEHTVLKSANVERKGLGITKVNTRCMQDSSIIYIFSSYLFKCCICLVAGKNINLRTHI